MSNPNRNAARANGSSATPAAPRRLRSGRACASSASVPVSVMTSPLQRAVDTATLLGVGEVRINPYLAEAGAAISREENERRADILRKLVGYHAGPDNLVIVTYKLNLIEAFGASLADMREGEAAVFEPDSAGDGYRVVARFQADDWDLLVAGRARRGIEPCPALRAVQGRAAYGLTKRKTRRGRRGVRSLVGFPRRQGRR